MTPDDKALRSKLIRLAATNPDLQPHLLPLLKEAGSDKVATNTIGTWYGFTQEGIKKAIAALEHADSANGTTISEKSLRSIMWALQDAAEACKELGNQADVLAKALYRNVSSLGMDATPETVEKIKSWLQTLVDPHFRG